MNAISPPDIAIEDRVSRHMRICAELAEFGTALSRVLVRKALEELDTPAPSADAPGAEAPMKAAGKAPNHAQTFLRLSTLVRQLMTMETRLAGGEAPRPRARTARPPTDLRRDLLRQAIALAVGDGAERAVQRQTAYLALDQLLAADPNSEKRAAALLHTVLDPLGVSISFSKMPTALRDALTGKNLKSE